MTWHEKSGSGSASGSIKVFEPGSSYASGLVFDRADNRIYDVLAESDEVPSQDIDRSHFTPLGIESQYVCTLSTRVATSPHVKIKTSNDADYEIDWGEGAGYVAAASWSTIQSAVAGTHPVKVRFAKGQYPIEIWFAGGWSINDSDLASLNRYNTVKEATLHQGAYWGTTIKPLAEPGAVTEYLSVSYPTEWVPGSAFSSVVANLKKLQNLIVVSGNPDPWDYDDIDSEPLESLLLTMGATAAHGKLDEFINRHPNLTNTIHAASADSTVTVDTVPVYPSEMYKIDYNMPLSTQAVDNILEGLATRPNPSWFLINVLTLDGKCAEPGYESIKPGGWLEQIAAQTGSPTISVNQTPIEVSVPVSAAGQCQLLMTTEDSSDYEIDWGEGVGYEVYTSAVMAERTVAGPTTITVRFALGISPITVRFNDGFVQLTESMINEFNRYNQVRNFYVTSVDNPHIIDLDLLNFTELKLFYISNATYVGLAGDMSDFISRNNLNYIYLNMASTTTYTIDTPPVFPIEGRYYRMERMDQQAVDNLLRGIAENVLSWWGNKLVDLSDTTAAIPSAAGLADKAIIEGQTGSPTVTVRS